MGADSHRKNRRRSKRKFIQIFHDVMESAAFRSLSPAAVAALLQVCHRYNGENNGKISFSCRELAERMGVGKDRANRALMDLVDRGFLVTTTKGWFSTKHRHATEWRITFQPCGRQAPTKDYETWQPAPGLKDRVAPADERPENHFTVLKTRTPGPQNRDTTSRQKGTNGPQNEDTTSQSTVPKIGTHVESTIPPCSPYEEPEMNPGCPDLAAHEADKEPVPAPAPTVRKPASALADLRRQLMVNVAVMPKRNQPAAIMAQNRWN